MARVYTPYIVVDASGPDSVVGEQAALVRMVQAGCILTDWVAVAAELMHDWKGPADEDVQQLFADHSPATGYLGNMGSK